MRDWISDLLIFSAGITGGVLVTMIKPILSAAKRRRTELVAARTRILADMKEQHDKEILHDAFRATEAIRGEINTVTDSPTMLRNLTKGNYDLILNTADNANAWAEGQGEDPQKNDFVI